MPAWLFLCLLKFSDGLHWYLLCGCACLQSGAPCSETHQQAQNQIPIGTLRNHRLAPTHTKPLIMRTQAGWSNWPLGGGMLDDPSCKRDSLSDPSDHGTIVPCSTTPSMWFRTTPFAGSGLGEAPALRVGVPHDRLLSDRVRWLPATDPAGDAAGFTAATGAVGAPPRAFLGWMTPFFTRS